MMLCERRFFFALLLGTVLTVRGSSSLAATLEATSVFDSSCSNTCAALHGRQERHGEALCRMRCKRQKLKSARQATQRSEIAGVGYGGDYSGSTRGDRVANATAACSLGLPLAIERWGGRLGNSLYQLANCLSFAHAANCACSAPYEGNVWRYLDASKLGPRLRRRALDEHDKTAFVELFYDIASPGFLEPSSSNLKNAVIHDLRGAWNLQPAPSTSYDVHIHIRSGDVYAVHDQTHYIPPPLSFYVDLIEAGNFKSIKLCAEDDQNPVIGALMDRYPGTVFFEPASLDEDIAEIVSAKRVIYGQGTFVPALLLFNDGLEAYYRISYSAVEPHLTSESNAVAQVVDLMGFFKVMFPWAATGRQLSLQLEWPRCEPMTQLRCAPRSEDEQQRNHHRRRCQVLPAGRKQHVPEVDAPFCWKLEKRVRSSWNDLQQLRKRRNFTRP